MYSHHPLDHWHFHLHRFLAARRHGGDSFGDDEFSQGGGRFGGHQRAGGRFGRRFGHGDLKLLLLGLTEAQPRHGYELIRAIEELCGGTYTPSPGAIYPALSFLEESGYLELQAPDDSAKKRYAITAEGRRHLQDHRAEVEAVMQNLRLSARLMSKLQVPESVRGAMHQLKTALVGHERHWDAAEAARVQTIIEQAVAAIGRADAP